MAPQMLCCMISTQSEINQSNLRHPYPIHHGIADALLHDLHIIRNQSIKPTYHGVADALLHELQKSEINQ